MTTDARADRHPAPPAPRAGMRAESRRLAGILLLVLPTVVFGGVSLLRLLVDDPAYRANELRQDLWRAGHAHAAVLLVLALVVLRYVDEADLGPRALAVARHAVPLAAILLPVAFFLAVLDGDATEPNALINLAYLGAASLVVGLLTLGVGLVRRPQPAPDPTEHARSDPRGCSAG